MFSLDIDIVHSSKLYKSEKITHTKMQVKSGVQYFC